MVVSMGQKVSVPYRGDWGLLRKNKKWYDLKLQMFPPPLKVTEGSYRISKYPEYNTF